MTLHCDSSALFKIYVVEPHTETVQQKVRAAATVVTSSIARVEIRAALARLRRERRLSEGEAEQARRQLREDWSSFVLIGPSDVLLDEAARLAEEHGLRALDSIHLASFQQVRERTDDDVEFSSFDSRLVKAAKRLR